MHDFITFLSIFCRADANAPQTRSSPEATRRCRVIAGFVRRQADYILFYASVTWHAILSWLPPRLLPRFPMPLVSIDVDGRGRE